MARRVLIAGLFHETHTFLEGTTPLDQFHVRRGGELLSARGDGSPLGAMLDFAAESGWEVVPAADLRAMPGPTCEDSAYDLFRRELTTSLVEELGHGLDGILLVLHGAMVCESTEDVEGDLLKCVRAISGAERLPICGVLDLHGNISRATAELSQGMVAYRSNPHTDAAAAAVDGARVLRRIFDTRRAPTTVWAHAPVMWPPTGTGTADDPMRALEEMARGIERRRPEILAVNVFAGYSFADTTDTGVSFSAVTLGDPDTARGELDGLRRWAVAHRRLGCVDEPALHDVMTEIAARACRGEGPILIVEPADNIGGGAPGDGTSVLRALLQHGVDSAVVVLNDPDAVRRVSALRPGESLRLDVGGRGSRLTEGPLAIEAELLSTSDGRFELEDPHSHLASLTGRHVEMGPCAVVLSGGVRVLLTSRKTPPFDLGQLRSQGIAPERASVIGVKAAVAHRRAYDPIARASYTVATPGPCPSDLRGLPFRRVRRPVFPLDELAGPDGDSVR